MKKIGMISYYILLILLCLNLLILSILLPLKYTLFNEEYMKQELIRQNYDTKVYEEIKTQMNHYLIQSGLDESVFDNIITEEKVKEDITNNLTSLYENKESHIDTTSITNQLEENIEKYLASQNIEVKDTESLNAFVKQIGSIYDEELNLYGSFPKLQKIMFPLSNVINIIIIINILIILVTLMLIKIILKKKVGSVPFFVTGVLLFLIENYVLNHVDIAHLLIIDKNFSSLLNSFLNQFFTDLTQFSYLFLGIGIGYLLIRMVFKMILQR